MDNKNTGRHFYRLSKMIFWNPYGNSQKLLMFDRESFLKESTEILKNSNLKFDEKGTGQDQITWKFGTDFNKDFPRDLNFPLYYWDRFVEFQNYLNDYYIGKKIIEREQESFEYSDRNLDHYIPDFVYYMQHSINKSNFKRDKIPDCYTEKLEGEEFKQNHLYHFTIEKRKSWVQKLLKPTSNNEIIQKCVIQTKDIVKISFRLRKLEYSNDNCVLKVQTINGSLEMTESYVGFDNK